MNKTLSKAIALVAALFFALEVLELIGTGAEALTNPIIAAVVGVLLVLFVVTRVSIWLDRH